MNYNTYIVQELAMKRDQIPYSNTIPFLNQKLNYWMYGKGQPVIFLHGGVTSSSTYIPFLKKLGAFYKVYALDMPGYGASDTIPNRLHNTDLFAEALCTFVNTLHLENIPIISFSTTTVAHAKAYIKGCIKGKMIFVGVPGKLTGWQIEYFNNAPLWLKRFVLSTKWGKLNLLLPILTTNTGLATEKINTDIFLEAINHTDPKGIADLDVKKEFEEEMPILIKQIKVPMTFIYGEYDVGQKTTSSFIKRYIIIKNSDHNVFSIRPNETIEVLKKILH
jgi:pimeloyl-ACP methyl ester carboxylesterase